MSVGVENEKKSELGIGEEDQELVELLDKLSEKLKRLKSPRVPA